jgi:Zn-dependent M28 family amino/carboxypeptidase
MRDAQAYIAAALKAEGIPVTYQAVAGCRNMIATIEGTQPETHVVVGAHLDGLGVFTAPGGRKYIQNGADDNATGSAVILELAKRVKQITPIRTVKFIWFTAEEDGLVGSRHYVKNNPLPVAMLNLDMVGHLKDNLRDRRKRSKDPGDLDHLYEKYEFARRITYRGAGRASDQAPFARAGVPSMMLITGLHDKYHTSRDDADTLDYEGLEKVANYAFDIIVHIAGRQEYRLYDPQ